MTTLEVGKSVRPSAVSRLDRLPIGSFHKMTMWLIAYVFFFELGDLNTFAFAAPALRQQWNLSIGTIGVITSAGFIGMFLGSTIGGWFADTVGRKKGLLITTAWYSGFSLLNASGMECARPFHHAFSDGRGPVGNDGGRDDLHQRNVSGQEARRHTRGGSW